MTPLNLHRLRATGALSETPAERRIGTWLLYAGLVVAGWCGGFMHAVVWIGDMSR